MTNGTNYLQLIRSSVGWNDSSLLGFSYQKGHQMDNVLTTRETEVVEKVKKQFRMDQYEFTKDEKCDGVDLQIGSDHIVLDHDSRNRIVKFRLN